MEQYPEDLPYKRWLRNPCFIVLLIGFVLMSFVYSLVLPLGEAADEFEHFALIRFIAENRRPPLTLQEQQRISAKGDASPLYHGLVAVLTQHVATTTLPELPDPRHRLERAIPYDRLPFKGLYHTEDESFPFHGIVLAWHLARLVSIPLAVVTILAVYLMVLTLFPDRPFLALAAAAFVAFIPRFVINSAIVSDDNLVLPLIALAILVLVRIGQGHRRTRNLVILGLLLGLAAVAKYHALLLLPLAIIFLAALAWSQAWGVRAWLRRGAVVMLAFLLIAGTWFLFLFIQFNQVADRGWYQGLIAPLGDPVIAAGAGRLLERDPGINFAYEQELGLPGWLALLFRTFWFRYGRGHVIAHPLIDWSLGLLTLLSLVGLAFGGLQVWRQRRAYVGNARAWRLDIILLVLLLTAYLGLVTTRYLALPTRETAQGRHLYPTLTSLAIFFVLGLSQLPRLFGSLKARRFNVSSAAEARSGFDKILFLGIAGFFFLFAALSLPLFVVPVYYPYLPITRLDPAEAASQGSVAADLGHGLKLNSYVLTSPQVTAGQALPVTLFWRSGETMDRDYLVQLCLFDESGHAAACRQGHPADGRYPTRAWEPDYSIRDEIHLPTPACLPPGNYELKLSARPLRLDTAQTTIDDRLEAGDAIALASVFLSGGQPGEASGFDMWLGSERYTAGTVDLSQNRQAITVIDYQRPENGGAHSGQVRFVPAPADSATPQAWSAIAPPVSYACPDGVVATGHNLIVDPSVNPGTYRLKLGDRVTDELQVAVSTRSRNYRLPAGLSTDVNASIGGEVELLGYNFDPQPRRPGESVEVELYWLSLNTMKNRYVGSLHLLDRSIAMWGQTDHVLGDDFEYPNVLWAPGEVIKQVYHLPIDQQTPAGLYGLEFGVYDNSSGDFNFLPITFAGDTAPVKHLNLGQLRVVDQQQAKLPYNELAIDLGHEIQLIGFDLYSNDLTTAQTLDFALHWQAVEQPDSDYTVFTQLIGPDGLVWGQQDNQPQDGRYPTTAWTENDRIIDRYQLTLEDAAPPGQYRLVVGMYDLSTGQRLSTMDQAGRPLPDNAVELITLTLVE